MYDIHKYNSYAQVKMEQEAENKSTSIMATRLYVPRALRSYKNVAHARVNRTEVPEWKKEKQ